MKFFVALATLGLLASVADGGVSMHDPFFCYSTDPIRAMTHNMGFITSYEAIRRFNFSPIDPYIPTGTPSRFWYFGRSASHLPHAVFIQEMLDFADSSVQADIVRNYEAGRTTLCRPDFEAIRNFDKNTYFEFDFITENSFMVMESGVIATQNIARRFQQTFPNILTQTYSPDRFHFRYANTVRSNGTMRAFASGLFGEDGAQNVIYEDIPAVDWFLRSWSTCPAFRQEIANSNDVRDAFEEGPEFEEMIEQINRKLGFRTSNKLGFNQIFNMWNWCRYKTAETFETSNSETGGNATWCAPFSVAHHHLLQYRIDLQRFYDASYGVRNQRLLQNLQCGPIQDLLTHMQSNNNTDQMARIFLTDPDEVLLLLTALGTFRDPWPLHQFNYAQQSDRSFTTNLIALFSTNLAVVRYDSDDGDHDLVFLLNERPLLVPGCDQQTGVCKLSVFVNRFQRFISANCEVLFCSND